MAPNRRYDFFVSFRWSTGLKLAQDLTQQLQDWGYTVFLCTQHHTMGEQLTTSYRDPLYASKSVIAIVTPGYLESPSTIDEVTIAKRIGIPIHPLIREEESANAPVVFPPPNLGPARLRNFLSGLRWTPWIRTATLIDIGKKVLEAYRSFEEGK